MNLSLIRRLMYDLCIIGGGAAGMAAAIAAAKNNKKVILIEKNNKLGKKLYATGNGRCNITNTYFDLDKVYNSSYEDKNAFLEAAIGKNANHNVEAFFHEIGVRTRNLGNYIYPYSLQASSVVWAMIDCLEKYGVKTLLKAEITDITPSDAAFTVIGENQRIMAKNVILANGGKSYSSLGGSSSGYALAKKLGHTLTNIRPALCALGTASADTELAGVRVSCNADLYINDAYIKSEAGELQFTDYGISGIMIFNLSSLCGSALAKNYKVQIKLDFCPDFTKEELMEHFHISSERSILGCLNGILNDKLSLSILRSLNISPKQPASAISMSGLHDIISMIKQANYDIDELMDYDKAQVCAGGVPLSEIIPCSCESKLCRGLYIVGELLDVDGLCGGYNLTFAIKTGLTAGGSI